MSRFQNRPMALLGAGLPAAAALSWWLAGMPMAAVASLALAPPVLLLHRLAQARARASQLQFRLDEVQSASQKLNAAVAELQQLSEHSPCACVSLDGEGRILRLNAVAADWLGWPAEELLAGRTLDEFLTPDVRARWHQAVASAGHGVESEPVDGVLRGRRRSPRWVRLSGRSTVAGDGAAGQVHAALFDISRQREAERSLQHINEQQRAIIDSDLLGIARIRDRMLVWASSGMTRVFGYSRDQLEGHATRRLFCSEEDWLQSGITALGEIRGQGSYRGELEMLHADGRRMWVEARAVSFDPQGDESLWLFTDMSARREAEAALRASQSFLARTGAVAGVGGFEIDVTSGRVRWSDETCRLHDVAPGATLDLGVFLEFHAAEGRAVIEQAVQEAIAFGASWDLELPMTAAGGRRFWARTVGAAEYENGRVVRLVGALQDITARRRMEHELTASRELLQVTLQSIGDAVITTDTEGRVTWLNPVAETLTGWHRELAVGHTLAEVYRAIDEDSRATLADPVARCLSEGKIVGLAGSSLLVARGRREYAVEDSVAPIRDEDGGVIGTVLVFRDVTAQRRMAREVAYRATHDALTDLGNRADFELRLGRLLAERDQPGGSHVIMYIDLDQFKLLNDSCGHLVGDQVLRQIASLFRYSVRREDVVARLGGDEFGVILFSCGIDGARRMGEQICRSMESYRFHFAGRRFRVGASIGLVPVDRRWRSVEALVEAADMACYAAKEAGRNRVWVWREHDRAGARSRVVLSWSTRLEQALEEGSFELHTQPVVPLAGAGPAQGWEVLLRLRERDGTLSMPGGFLPPAERFHFLPRLDRWVVGAVLRCLASGCGPWLPGQRIGINLSAQSMADAPWRDELAAQLRAQPLAAGRLSFEMSEQAVLSDLVAALELAAMLRAAGAQVVIDDFGGTTAAFGYLHGFPVDLVKVDRNLCEVLPGSALDQAVLRSCLDLARVLGVPAVAKGLATEGQCHAALALGFAWGQGFALAAPARLAERGWLADNLPGHTRPITA